MRKSLMRMTLRQLQIFNEVCDLRSYSRAAEEMSSHNRLLAYKFANWKS